jgi:hypothetical protein
MISMCFPFPKAHVMSVRHTRGSVTGALDRMVPLVFAEI